MKSTNPKAKIKGPDKFDETQVYSLEVTGFPIENCRVEWYFDKHNRGLVVDTEDVLFNPKEVTVIGNESGKGTLRAKISYYETYINDKGEDAFNLIGVKKIHKKIICNTPVEEDDDDDTRSVSRATRGTREVFNAQSIKKKVRRSKYKETADNGGKRLPKYLFSKNGWYDMQSAMEEAFPRLSGPKINEKLQKGPLKYIHRHIFDVITFLNTFVEKSDTQVAYSARGTSGGARLVTVGYYHQEPRYIGKKETAVALQSWPKLPTGAAQGFKQFGSTGFIVDGFTLWFNLKEISQMTVGQFKSTLYHELIHALGLQAMNLVYRDQAPVSYTNINVPYGYEYIGDDNKIKTIYNSCGARYIPLLRADKWPNALKAYKSLLTNRRGNSEALEGVPFYVQWAESGCSYAVNGSSLHHTPAVAYFGDNGEYYYGFYNNMMHYTTSKRIGKKISHLDLGILADLGYVVKKRGQPGIAMVSPERHTLWAHTEGSPNYTTGPVRGALTKGNTRAIKPLPKFDNYDVSTPEGDKKRTSALFEFLIDSNM